MTRPKTRGAELLGEFLAKHSLTQTAAAAELHVERPSITEWVNGVKRPDAHTRRAIATWTSDHVPAESWELDTERERVEKVHPFCEAEPSATGTEG